jgi:hypothetical protein
MEAFLSGLNLKTIITRVPGSGSKQVDVLSRTYGKGAEDAAHGGGPFSAYLVSETEKFAISPGTIVKNVQTGESMEPDGSGAYYDILSGTKAWIKCAIAADLTLTSAAIETGAVWPADNGVTFAGDVQTHAYVHIGSVKDWSLSNGEGGFDFSLTRDGESRDYHFDQKIQTHLFLALMVVDGKAAVFPLPFSG